ncbi:Eco57I restriction-modification methylase domain-containing protein [Isoptericola sp. NPDC057653]|uniref:Eco57I restriction-modification methylase domain-containing protein n=1 Tax=Isoptericola sp. NPDC057653 TaxID=3346195 RepID=UPI00367CEA84
MSLKERTEARRRDALGGLDPAKQSAMGQFFTPAKAADLIASMLRVDGLSGVVRVLDPGAGAGSLTVALLERITSERPDLDVEATVVEVDPHVIPALRSTLGDLESTHGVRTRLVEGDYVALATMGDPRVTGPFDLVIQNPPYGKLPSADPHRVATAVKTVDTPNVYSAFWALAVDSLAPGGQCVTIVPRSWANGTYFSAFRKWLLSQIGLDRLHVFESRSTVFADSGVLQENVIVSGTRGAWPDEVVLSASVGHNDHVDIKSVSSKIVVVPGDKHQFVRFTDGATNVPAAAKFTLADLGIKASTGRVVDFRSRDWLVTEPTDNTVPMVYQANVRHGRITHPLSRAPKPQWFVVEVDRARKLTNVPGNYVVIKRFSAKEERRRVVAGVWDRPGVVAFDNKTNYLHENGSPLEPLLAQGLAVWLNSTPLDEVFRTFSGHTQVNAGDLGVLPFPSRDDLVELGAALPGELSDQDLIDKVVEQVLSA